MTLLQSIILGIVQGATEFLPISSSGHIVLVPSLLGWEIPQQDAFIFNVMVQAATLIAVIYYFWQDLVTIAKSTWQALIQKRPFDTPEARLGWYIVLATIPAGMVGFFFNDFFEEIFSNPLMAAIFLIGTAGFLIAAERTGKRVRCLEEITWKDALWVGVFQVFALFPGISRSGATITGAMLKNIDRPSAARFSFLISVPLMIGAGGSAFYQFLQLPDVTGSTPIYLAGCVSAAIVGYLSIRWLLKFLTQRSLYTFAFYCLGFAGLNLAVIALR